MKHIIGFPGLFKDRFVVDRVAFDMGKLFGMDKSIPVYWYGLIIVSAMIVAYVYFMLRAKRTEGIVEDDSMNIALFALPIGIIGARTFYVLTHLSYYDSFKDAVLGMRDGGLAIYGGIVFGLATVLVYCLVKKVNTYKVLDSLAPAVMIAQAIGRWGNFFNAEAYGSTDGIKSFFLRMSIADIDTPYHIRYVHPTFLYESLWNILGFVVANIIYKKKKFDGQIFCFYLFWYGIGRAFIELLRTDSCMIFKSLESDPLDIFDTASDNGLKVFVYLSILLVIVSIFLYIYLRNKSKKDSAELAELQAVLCGAESENDDSANDDSVNDESANDDSANDDSVNDDSANDDSVNDDSVNDDSANDDSVNDDSANDDSVNDESANDESANDNSSSAEKGDSLTDEEAQKNENNLE